METSPQSLAPLLEMYERDLASGMQDAPWPPVYPKMPGEPPRVAPSRAKKAGLAAETTKATKTAKTTKTTKTTKATKTTAATDKPVQPAKRRPKRGI
jgi:hypothetical protein